jgi:cytochrome c peroxidase
MRKFLIASSAALAAASVLGVSCGKQGGVPFDRARLAVFQAEWGKQSPPAPEVMVALGRDLYHEERLSTKQNQSCASCHDLAKFGQDGEPTSPGSEGLRGDRNSPTSVNAFRQIAQFWDGRAADVEAQAQGPVLNPIEHGFAKEEDFVASLKGIEGMAERFAAAFPGEADPVTLANFGRAVGAFERTLVTRGRWEAFLDGDDAALSDAEKAGLQTFLDVGCTTCHIGRTLGGGMFQKLGLVVPFETEDLGRFKVTNNEADKFSFKVPMLLNVAKTAPYYHDGKIATLEEAVRMMAKHQLGRDLSAEQIASIVTFLNALTGEPQWKS